MLISAQGFVLAVLFPAVAKAALGKLSDAAEKKSSAVIFSKCRCAVEATHENKLASGCVFI